MSSRLLKPESVAAKARKRQRDTETTLDYDSVKYLSSETPVVKKMAGMEIYIDRMTTTRASRGSSDLEKSKNRKKRTLEGGMRREAYGTGVKVEREIKARRNSYELVGLSLKQQNKESKKQVS